MQEKQINLSLKKYPNSFTIFQSKPFYSTQKFFDTIDICHHTRYQVTVVMFELTFLLSTNSFIFLVCSILQYFAIFVLYPK